MRAPAGAGGGSLAQDLRGDALADLALGPAVFQEHEVGVRVHVNEAGGDDQAPGVDLAAGGPFQDAADSNDPIPADGDIAVEPWVTAAVDDLAVTDDQVVFGSGPGRGVRAAGQNQHGPEPGKSAKHR